MAGRSDIKLAADIGGTFTDIVLDIAGKRMSGKVLTTSDAPEACSTASRQCSRRDR